MDKIKEIADIILMEANWGDCDSCCKEGCDECFEGSYWCMSEKHSLKLAKKIIKIAQKGDK